MGAVRRSDQVVTSDDGASVLEIVATDVFADVHITDELRTSVDPSVNVPVAVNFCVKPFASDGSAGVTAIEATTAGVTVSVVAPPLGFPFPR